MFNICIKAQICIKDSACSQGDDDLIGNMSGRNINDKIVDWVSFGTINSALVENREPKREILLQTTWFFFN